MDTFLKQIKRIIPTPLFKKMQPHYHKGLAFLGALVYRFPSRSIYTIGVTGTKGKSSVAEITHALLTAGGNKTAVLSTIHFKIGDKVEPNLFKMTTPGRFFVQKFLRRAVSSGCSHVIIEMTSEAAVQYRHSFIDLDALIFTNLTPEHIESHGSFEKYKEAKLSIVDRLKNTSKKNTVVVANTDDSNGKDFLDRTSTTHKISYTLSDLEIRTVYPNIEFNYEDTDYRSPLQGTFNVQNILGALKLARHLGVSKNDAQRALTSLVTIPGRVQYVDGGQSFPVVVDYAHTPDSLEQFYKSFPQKQKICVLGNTGGGRDTWKRPKMAKIAEAYCEKVILTNEDPYDEDPQKIIDEMAEGMEQKPIMILDRRKAIASALANAQPKGIVLITGKGTDPYIMGANNEKQPWSDHDITLEELKKMKTA